MALKKTTRQIMKHAYRNSKAGAMRVVYPAIRGQPNVNVNYNAGRYVGKGSAPMMVNGVIYHKLTLRDKVWSKIKKGKGK